MKRISCCSPGPPLHRVPLSFSEVNSSHVIYLIIGTTYVETYLFDCDTRHKASAEAVGGGARYAPAPGRAILAHREPKGVLHTYVRLNKPEDWIARIDFSDRVTALACVAKEFDGRAPELTALIIDGETDPVPRPIHSLPVEHRWIA